MKILQSTSAFTDTAISLKSELGDTDDGTVIILGGNVFAEQGKTVADFRKDYKKVIVFNQEQLADPACPFRTAKYAKFMSDADELWDYEPDNAFTLYNHGIRNDTLIHKLKPCKELDAGTANKTVDVLFYGSMNDRRRNVLNELTRRNVSICCVSGLHGDELNPYIASARICLNIHYYETALQEQARMIRWVSSNANIISECSKANHLNVPEVPYQKLADAVQNTLKELKNG